MMGGTVHCGTGVHKGTSVHGVVGGRGQTVHMKILKKNTTLAHTHTHSCSQCFSPRSPPGCIPSENVARRKLGRSPLDARTAHLMAGAGSDTSSLLQLPLEILTEVCMQLDQHDLVRVAAACKRFRHGDSGLAPLELPTKSPVITALRKHAFPGGE